MVVLPTMLLLPPLSTFAAGASEVPFWMILHRAMRALDEPTTLTPVPLLFEIVVVSMFATLPDVGSAVWIPVLHKLTTLFVMLPMVPLT